MSNIQYFMQDLFCYVLRVLRVELIQDMYDEARTSVKTRYEEIGVIVNLEVNL